MEQDTSRKEPQSSFRGLYRHVKISVKTLDKIIIGGILAIVLILLYGVSNNGYTITFDSNGGTDVPAQELMYGDLVVEPEPPTREGYTFSGWFKDENCLYEWNMEEYQVAEPMTLYALWIPETE
ncbi:MAG: InlB B-repeat-containing protein [Oscillospiraceae bacterium]|nr:InlB B-repeat-containing protein [Oscillospiraceae bacterium]